MAPPSLRPPLATPPEKHRTTGLSYGGMVPRHAKLAIGTSRRFPMPARIVRDSYGMGILGPGMHILEVGGGALRNSLWLQERRLIVDAVELPAVINRYPREYELFALRGGRAHTTLPNRRFDAVVCTFVLGTITPTQSRHELLVAMKHSLRREGVLLLAVRGPGDVKTKARSGRRWRDGFLTPNGSFIKPFRRSELLALCMIAGFRRSLQHSPLESHSGIVDFILERAQ